MAYAYFKALHLIFVVTWFAGLFYLVRLFIYHTEAHENLSLSQDVRNAFKRQYQLMEKRLWYGITWPSALLTTFLGLAQLPPFIPIAGHPWLIIKLVLVFFLFLYHLSLGHLYKSLKRERYPLSSFKLRIWNEVATLFLIAIVFLAVLKSLLSLAYGLLGLLVVMIALSLAIAQYRRLRSKEK